MMEWRNLLCAERLGRVARETPQRQRSPFQRDYDRIVFSSAFRRLQDKTQVFPLAESDYVRTRLTHSLEASCVGRSLGTRVGEGIVERHGLEGVHASDVGAIVAAACLAHDIGNPPFGHSGEDSIRHWFLHSPVAAAVSALLPEQERADFARFEGNAQGFRILTRLQMPDNPGGLQLTCATLGAFAKYTAHSGVSDSERRASTKKFSFFRSEEALFAQVAEHTGLFQRAEGWWCRHPLAYLVEAADDICYRLVDFEDGLRLGLLSYEEVSGAFFEIATSEGTRRGAGRIRGEKERVEFLRAQAIGAVLDQVAAAFEEHEEALLAGEFEEPLIDRTVSAGPLQTIIARSRQTVYSSPRGLEIEAAGYEVIGGLLDLFVGAVEDAARHGKGASPRSRSILKLAPEQFIGPGREPDPCPSGRLRRMTDFVSGMTDSYAVGLYRKLRGISLIGK